MTTNVDGVLGQDMMQPIVAEALTRAELDRQVATAKQFPRGSIARFLSEGLAALAVSDEVAGECVYVLPPRGKERKRIAGPSARLAEIVAHCWGNCRLASRIVDDAGDFITAQGAFFDLERNVAVSFEVKRRIVDSDGRRYSPDMVATTGNAASSIAIRNATLKGIPKHVWAPLYDAATRAVAGSAANLPSRRAMALEHLRNRYSVDEARALAVLGVTDAAAITGEHLVVLRGLITAINDGDSTVERAFPPVGDAATQGAVDRVKDKLRKGKVAAVPAGQAAGEPEAVRETPPATAADADVRPMCSRCTNESTHTLDGVPYCVVHLPGRRA